MLKTSLDVYFAPGAFIRSEIDIEIAGEILSPGALQKLAGCPAGGTVIVDNDPENFYLTVRHFEWIRNDALNANQIVIRADELGYYLYLEYIWFAEACPKGLGAVMLLKMAEEAQRLGFSRIELLAAGGSGIKQGPWNEAYWGYECWPPILALTKHVPHLAAYTRVSEIVEADLDWWKDHGDGWEMRFE